MHFSACTALDRFVSVQVALCGEWRPSTLAPGGLRVQLWPQLLKEGTDKPNNMYTWWAMKEKYQNETTRLETRDAVSLQA